MSYPQAPDKIVPFNSARKVSQAEIGEQFAEHTRSIRSIIEFLTTFVRDDGLLRNGVVQKEQLDPKLPEMIAASALRSVQEMLSETAIALASVQQNASESLSCLQQTQKLADAVGRLAQDVSRAAQDVRARSEQILSVQGPVSRDITEVSGMTTRMTVLDASTPGAQDWAEASQDWAEHMPDPIPGKTLGTFAITGQHWSARWWATQANGAFGRLQDLYLGVWPSPPTTNLTGGPLAVGCIYYDSSTLQPYVWTGTAWETFWSPQKAATASLFYLTNANQTVFNVTVPDIIGNNSSLANGESVMVFLNGIRLTPDNDYTVNTVNSTVTLLVPQPGNAMVAIDVLTPADQLRPGAVNATMLSDITSFQDGVQTQFNLLVMSSGVAAPVQAPEHLIVSLDGVIQKPGATYTVSAPNVITFSVAPTADAQIFMVWLEPPSG